MYFSVHCMVAVQAIWLLFSDFTHCADVSDLDMFCSSPLPGATQIYDAKTSARRNVARPKFRAVLNQANRQHVQNGAPKLRGGSSFPTNDKTQPCTTHSVSFFLCICFFLGPESITCFSSKTWCFLRVGSWFYSVGFLISLKRCRISTIMNRIKASILWVRGLSNSCVVLGLGTMPLGGQGRRHATGQTPQPQARERREKTKKNMLPVADVVSNLQSRTATLETTFSWSWENQFLGGTRFKIRCLQGLGS